MSTPEAPDTPDDFASRLLAAQASQHNDRQETTRELIGEVKSMSKHVGLRFDRIETELHNKPGKAEVRAVMLVLAGVFLLMLNSFLQSKGVDTEKAGNEARKMLAPTMDLITTPAAPASTDDGQHLTP